MLPHWIEKPDPSLYLDDDYLVLDFENTIVENDGSPLNPDVRLLLACWTYKGREKFIWGGECDMQPLLEDLEEATFLVAQGSKHELQWLHRAGFPLNKVLVYDTAIAEYVLDGNKPTPKDLGSISKKYGYGGKEPYVDLCMKAGICPSTLPRSMLLRRCLMDIRQTHKIFMDQKEELVRSDKLKTLYTRCLLTPVLADIEFNGMYLDHERVEKEYTEHVARHTFLQEKLQEGAEGINFNSPKQLGEYLYDTLGFKEPVDRKGNVLRTASGGRRTDTATLSGLRAKTKAQKEFIATWTEYNKLSSALSKNLEFFVGVVKEKDCTFQGVFNQLVTATHRLSSSGRRTHFDMFPRPKSVQFQNMPRAFKSLFTPRNEGWVMGEIDGAQLEFRVAVQLGHDEVGLKDILGGRDAHAYTAQVLTDNNQPTNRQGAKAHTFKPLFGGKSGTPAERAYYQAFQDRYEGVTGWQETNKWHVLDFKSLVIPSGLEFFWPDTRLERNDYITNSTQICNYPVQSIATADIIPIGIAKLWHELKAREMQSFLVNTIHDSGIAEIHPEEIEEFGRLSSEALTTYVYQYLLDVYDYKWFVPLAAGYKVGSHWSEGEEIVYDSTPPFTYEEVA